jgi:hypothetical protein
MDLHKAIPDDARAISNVRVAAWQGACQEFMPSEFLSALDPVQELGNWRESLSNPSEGWAATVVEENGEIVGLVVVGAPHHESAAQSSELDHPF